MTYPLPPIADVVGPYLPAGTPDAPDTPLAVRVYESLPGYIRAADGSAIMRRFTVAAVSGSGYGELLFDAIDYIAVDEGGPPPGSIPGGASLLTDPANTPWPEWLAQVLGVDFAAAGITDPTSTEAREFLAAAANGWRAGSRQSLAAAAARTLTGTRTVRVRAHANVDPFVITISTVAAETPDTGALHAAVEAVRPAGHSLAYDNNVGNWAGIEAAAWAGVDAATAWADVEALYA